MMARAPLTSGVAHKQNCKLPLRLYLMRHGETEWSRSGQYTGRTDIPLTARGEYAARQLGLRLRGITFAHVLSSPLQRAQQTCAQAALGLTPQIEPDLTEWDNGDDEGHTPADILKSRPGWNLFRDGAPNGETPPQISARADRLTVREPFFGIESLSYDSPVRLFELACVGCPRICGRVRHFHSLHSER